MSHIIKSESDREYLSNLVFDIVDNGFDKEKVEDILSNIIPKDVNDKILINYNVRETGGATAIFIPRYKVIQVSIDKINSWLDNNIQDLTEMYSIKDREILKSYLVLMILTHEVEHSYQYLIGKGIIDTPCKMLQQGYRTLTELMVPKDYIIPRPVTQIRRVISVIKYKSRENEFLLERNAQYDSLSLLASVAGTNGHDDIMGMFISMKNIFAKAGYIRNADGTLVNTFKDICMGDKLKRFDEDYEKLDMMERFRLGLPIDEKTRKRVLAIK